MNIYIEKLTDEELPFAYEEVADQVTEAVLQYFNCPYEATVNLYIETEETIQSINKEHRNIDKVTDVLSFPNLSFDKEADFSFLEEDEYTYEYFDPDSGELILGDIIICQKRMEEQAKEYGHSLLREYAFLITHSMLHLLGFDHMEEEERTRMENLQREILNQLNITRED